MKDSFTVLKMQNAQLKINLITLNKINTSRASFQTLTKTNQIFNCIELILKIIFQLMMKK